MKILVVANSHRRLVVSVFFFFNLDILQGRKWYQIIVLICIFLIIVMLNSLSCAIGLAVYRLLRRIWSTTLTTFNQVACMCILIVNFCRCSLMLTQVLCYIYFLQSVAWQSSLLKVVFSEKFLILVKSNVQNFFTCIYVF